MSSRILSILSTLLVASNAVTPRQEEFSRIKDYELIHIDTDSLMSSNIIHFDAFGHHYDVELEVNADMIASDIRHNVDPLDHGDDHFFTSLTTSCHYFGRVLGVETSKVALSICDKRGIRGSVSAYGETLMIKPSAHYLEEDLSSHGGHDSADEHLVYRESDFDTTDIGRAETIGIDTDPIHSAVDDEAERRRMAQNGGNSLVEMLIVNGPIRTKHYQNDYGSGWYEQLVADYSDILNLVSADYYNTDWGSYVGGKGSVSVKFAELEVVFEFTGKYATLTPPWYYSDCQTSFEECRINGASWLGVARSWLESYKDTSTFDNVMLVVDIAFRPGVAGWGGIGTVCKGPRSVASCCANFGNDWLTRTIAHELGHNFGMHHDGQPGEGSECDANAGLMGYGNGVGFSWCSINSMHSYWTSNNGLSCLSYRDSPFRSNYNSDTSPVAVHTPAPTSSSGGGDETEWNCVGISYLENDDYPSLSGYWSSTGRRQDGKLTYYRSGYYLYFLSAYNFWVLGQEEGSSSVFGYCTASDLSACTAGSWNTISSGGGSWSADGDATAYDCGDGEGTEDGGSCTHFDCLGISGLMADSDGMRYDGYWYPAGCHNGESYYERTVIDDNRFLCFSSDHSTWIISDTLCGPSNLYAYTWGDLDGAGSPNADSWGVWTGSWTMDNDVYVYDCGGSSGAFEEDCDSDYGDDLCIFSNETLWSGDRQFARSEQCSNGRPVFQFMEYTTSSAVAGEGEVESVELSLYLHYHRESVYSDSNETVAQWIISKNEISVNALALCEEEDVRDCTASSWLVDTVQFHGDEFQDGVLQQVVDHPMAVREEQCGEGSVEDEGRSSTHSATTVIIVVVILLVAACGAIAFWWMNHGENDLIRRKMGGSKSPDALNDDSGDEAVASPQSELTQTVDVEAAPIADGGVPVTATVE